MQLFVIIKEKYWITKYMVLNLLNPKLIKEWNKIKESKNFDSFDSFAEFYYSNGEKCCYRKFTNQPWSKENFFFGTYQELLNFYKTDTTISKSMLANIGKKIYSLTILDIFATNSAGKKEIFAKCRCDCGKEVIKSYEAIWKGNARSCGCRGGKGAATIEYLPKEIVDSIWDFDKNGNTNPYCVPANSTSPYWWKDKDDKSYQLAPFVFLNRDSNTSFPEQAIYYYIKKYFSSAISRAHFITSDGEIVEIDIYIPTIKVGIEYDGFYWHQNKTEEDNYKNKVLNENNIYVIRVREEGLEILTTFNGFVINRNISKNSDSYLVDSINIIFDTLHTFSRKNFSPISYDEFAVERNSIYSYIYNNLSTQSLKHTCLESFWDKKLNGKLTLENVSIDSTIPIWFSCVEGKKFKISPKSFYDRVSNKRFPEYKCKNYYNCFEIKCCPFYNVSMCKDGYQCLARRKNKYPYLKCISSDIYSGEKYIKFEDNNIIYFIGNELKETIKKSSLGFIFKNNSPFCLDISQQIAFIINKKFAKYDYAFFTNQNNNKNIEPDKACRFKFNLTRQMQQLLCDGTLIIACRLWKNEYLHGWFFYAILIIDIGIDGKIIKQKFKTFSCDEFKNELDIFNKNTCNYIKSFEKILSKSLNLTENDEVME